MVGDVELDCDVFTVAGTDLRIVAYTAAAGIGGGEKLDFLRVSGVNSSPSPRLTAGWVQRMAAAFKDLCIDARDHQALADWWCSAMGYVRKDDVETDPDDDWTRPRDWPVPIVDPAGHGPQIWVVPVPEEKAVKNRVHWDVVGCVEELLAQEDAGARQRPPGGRRGHRPHQRRHRVGRARRPRGQRVLRLHPPALTRRVCNHCCLRTRGTALVAHSVKPGW